MSSISYSQERSRPFARSLICSLACCLSRLIPDCPDVMYKEYPYASCHTQHQGYGDGGIVKLLNHIKAKKKKSKKAKEKSPFSLVFNKRQELTFYFYAEKRKTTRTRKSIRWCRKKKRVNRTAK
jgi:hypothetical protein